MSRAGSKLVYSNYDGEARFYIRLRSHYKMADQNDDPPCHESCNANPVQDKVQNNTLQHKPDDIDELSCSMRLGNML
jgi:hypothetical protein